LYLRYVLWHKSPRRYQFNVNTQSFKGTLGWNANSTLGSLSITDPFNTADTQNCAYSHDDLTRIASANCGATTWQQTFSYDAFGNLTKSVPTGGTGNSFQPTYNAKNKHAALPAPMATSTHWKSPAPTAATVERNPTHLTWPMLVGSRDTQSRQAIS